MSRLDRFGRLEGPRETPAAPRSDPSVQGRFGPAPPEPDSGSPPSPRSGGDTARFEDKEPAPRLLDLDGGQGFVRCSACHQDHHVTAVRCQGCGADLTTRAQRNFNEALWKRQEEERAEQEGELARLRDERERAAHAQADVLRQWGTFTQEMERRRGQGGLLGDENETFAPVRRLGHGIGRWLRRVVPHRGLRFVIVGAFAAGLVLSFVALFGRVNRVLLVWMVLFAMAAALGRLTRGSGS